LFERDCSVQRRHQKVLEEAPAPGMSEARRRQMGEAAVAAAKAVGYVGAGTVEFIVEGDATGQGVGNFFFMEMNTRLQVEHPVTEAITGLDLVEWQLRVAAGEPLPLRQHELRRCGHAIEARICAENPEAGFLPATGRLEVLRWPAHSSFERAGGPAPGRPKADRPAPSGGDGAPAASGAVTFVRVDTGVLEGDAISPHYDSMIAKLIVWGEDRAQALARLDAALADTHIVGLHSNVAFLRRCAATPSFAGADLDTGLIERERARLFGQPGLSLRVAAAAVVAHTLALEAAQVNADPWSARDGWRLAGDALRRFDLVDALGETHHEVLLRRRHAGGMALSVGGETFTVAVDSQGPERHTLWLGEGLQTERVLVHTYAHGEDVTVFCAQGSATLTEVDVIARAGEHRPSGGRLTAPMPGKLVALHVKAGDSVTAGQLLAVMEAMKMEHAIQCPRDGVVAECLYAVGDQLGDGAELLRLQS
ncbi:MAG: biotin/lipoyl-binding protein, partial [Inhella sp.]|nr:biotin/lipoyl-binding protein [Inhella sp.]